MLKAQGGFGEMRAITIGDGNESGLPGALAGGSPENELEVSTRITVGLIAVAAAALEKTRDRCGLTQTDIVNRALTLYEFIDAELDEGAELFMRRDGRQYAIKLLSSMRRKAAAPMTRGRRTAPP